MNKKKTSNNWSIAIIIFLFLIAPIPAQSQGFLYGDTLPDAPELAKRGDYQVGVRTLNLLNTNQVDILNSKDGKDPIYDRPLTIEIWYPAEESDNKESVIYEEVMGIKGDTLRPLIPFTFKGICVFKGGIRMVNGCYYVALRS